MDKLVEKYNLPKLSEEAESLDRPIIADEIETIIKKLLTHKSPGDLTVSQENSTEHLRES